jgi:NAD(P)-dependent dehydrogenase (short-subunit alcohol dehydrogenase family)
MEDLFDFTGKVAVITGGSRGLGRQMALAYAARGADLVIASRKLENCQSVVDEIETMGRQGLALSIDATQWDAMDELTHAAYEHFGKVDILVNNAGKSPAIASHEITERQFDGVVDLNFKGPFRLAANIGRRMADAEGGVIINISSMDAVKPVPGVVPYSGAKAALNAMTVSLAHELGPKVRVNAIQAGPFLTDISKAWPEEMRQRAPNALGRPGNPEEVVTTALYLASDASRFVTGAIVACDGGTG